MMTIEMAGTPCVGQLDQRLIVGGMDRLMPGINDHRQSFPVFAGANALARCIDETTGCELAVSNL